MSREWIARAGCREVPPEVFFPVAVAGPAFERQVAAAKAVCAGCPVRSECLAWALADGALADGIAGGLTAEERRGLAGCAKAGRVGLPPAASARERACAGRAAIRAGRRAPEVAAEFEVTQRTAERWATAVRREQASAQVDERGVA